MYTAFHPVSLLVGTSALVTQGNDAILATTGFASGLYIVIGSALVLTGTAIRLALHFRKTTDTCYQTLES